MKLVLMQEQDILEDVIVCTIKRKSNHCVAGKW